MAKLKNDPVGKKDIQEYLEQSSNFAFELETLRLLTSLDFNCLLFG
mgnify:CR=1 FL=1